MSEFDEAPDDSWMPDPTAPAASRPRMKETVADKQVKEEAVRRSGDQLLDFIERYEGHEIEKKEASERMKAVMAELSGTGFNAKVVKKIIADRKRKPEEVREEEDLLQVYRESLGF
jgi:uncharacterized protein (UPF0335 family)